jgi:hypothetical protein
MLDVDFDVYVCFKIFIVDDDVMSCSGLVWSVYGKVDADRGITTGCG